MDMANTTGQGQVRPTAKKHTRAIDRSVRWADAGFESEVGPRRAEQFSVVWGTAGADCVVAAGATAAAAGGALDSAVPRLRRLLEALFFQAHAAERRVIRETDLETAAMGLARRLVGSHTSCARMCLAGHHTKT